MSSDITEFTKLLKLFEDTEKKHSSEKKNLLMRKDVDLSKIYKKKIKNLGGESSGKLRDEIVQKYKNIMKVYGQGKKGGCEDCLFADGEGARGGEGVRKRKRRVKRAGEGEGEGIRKRKRRVKRAGEGSKKKVGDKRKKYVTKSLVGGKRKVPERLKQWIQHVKSFAKKHGLKYNEALKHPNVKKGF